MTNLLMLFFFVPVLVLILLLLNLLLAVHRPDEEKLTGFECGYSPIHGQTRSSFSIHFYVVAMLFLVFDVEILLLFPVAMTLYQVSIFGFSMALVFFMVLTVGFVLELASGAVQLTDQITGLALSRNDK